MNLRDALRWLLLLSSGDESAAAAKGHDLFDVVFRRRFRTEEDMRTMDDIYATAFNSEPVARSFYHNLSPTLSQVGVALVPRTKMISHSQNPVIGLPSSHLPILEAMMIAARQSWPVVLVGAAGSGQTNLLHHLAARVGAKLIVLPMNSDIDATDLIGSFEQADPFRHHANVVAKLRLALQVVIVQALKTGKTAAAVPSLELLSCLLGISESSLPSIVTKVKVFFQTYYKFDPPNPVQSLIDQLEDLTRSVSNSRPTFQWVDGTLVQAVERGDWLVLDNANLCSSSVLDRLNSLLEPNGTLVINEHSLPNGKTRIVKPDPNFRIFLTLDPVHGELSSAMRNRALELFVPVPDESTAVFDLPMESATYNLAKVIETVDFATRGKDDIDDQQWADIAIDHFGLHGLIDCALKYKDQLHDDLRTGLLDGQMSPKIVRALERRLKQMSWPLSTTERHVRKFYWALEQTTFPRPWFPLMVSNP